MSFLGEIKRRKVFQVAVVYAVVAWLIIQIVDVVSSPLNLPEWFATVAIVLIGIGFPIAVILAWVVDMTPQGIQVDQGPASGESVAPLPGQRLNFAIQGLVLLAVAFLVVNQFVGEPQLNGDQAASPASAQPDAGTTVRRLMVPLGPTEPMGNPQIHADLAISADASRIAYVTQVDGRSQLYLRELDELTARAVPGTDGASDPFFSPDGLWVAFHGGESLDDLRKVSVMGGQPQIVAPDMRQGWGGSWSSDGFIYYSAEIPGDLYRVHRVADGGEPELLEANDDVADLTHGWVDALPGGSHLLYSTRPNDGTAAQGPITLLSLENRETRTLVENAYHARYVPSGHIVFIRADSIWAVPFDLEQLETAGPEVPVVNGVHSQGTRGEAAYAVSEAGVLIYLPGQQINWDDFEEKALVWLDREGREVDIDPEARDFYHPRLSPDGEKLAVSIAERNGNRNIWVYDLTSNAPPQRLTFGDGRNHYPAWSRDGQHIVYSAQRDAASSGMYRIPASGAGREERLTESALAQIPGSFSNDGDQLVYRQGTGGANRNVYLLSLEGESESRPLLENAFFETHPALSPDGNLLAYTSYETGRPEVYIRPFPNTDSAVQRVSNNSGEQPRWASNGDELLYLTESNEIMVARIETQPELSVGRPDLLLELDFLSPGDRLYDVTPDGQRLALVKLLEEDEGRWEQTNLVVVENWLEELSRLAPRSQ